MRYPYRKLLVWFVLVLVLSSCFVEGRKRKRRRFVNALYDCTSLPSIATYFSFQLIATDPVSPTVCKGDYEFIQQFDKEGVTGKWQVRIFVNKKTKMIIFVARGTVITSATDWANNLQYSLIPCDSPVVVKGQKRTPINKGCGDGKIHSGFAHEWAEAKPDILARVQALLKSGLYNKILITGHSKGGAISNYVAIEIRNSLSEWGITYIPSIYVITFGSPRPGDPKFAAVYKSYNFFNQRYVVYGDPVPAVPPMSSGYAHVTGDLPADFISLPCSWTGMVLACHTDYFQVNSQTAARAPFLQSLNKRSVKVSLQKQKHKYRKRQENSFIE